MTPEMDPKWFPQLPLIDLSQFPDLLKHCSLYILKNIKYLIMWELSISDNLALDGYRGQIRHFLNGLLTFLSIPQGGITCGAIDEPRKSSKAIDERAIINFRDKNVVIARFRDKNVYR